MSLIPIILFIVGIIVTVTRKSMGSGQPPAQHRQPVPRQYPYRQHEPAPTRPSTVERPQPSQTSSSPQQSAWDWMNGNDQMSSTRGSERDPEGETIMYKDVPEEWIHPIDVSVKMDLTEMQETQREIVHETVRESLHVRRDREAEAAQAARKPKNKIALNHSNLAQALILSEVLGEPRSKCPWKPHGNR